MSRNFKQTEWSLIDLLPDASEATVAQKLIELENAIDDFEPF